MYTPQVNITDGQEIRICFENIKIDSDYNRQIKGVVFYGDATTGNFTNVGIPNVKYPIDSHEFWLCSLPRDDPYITLIGIHNLQYNVSGTNTISQFYNSAQLQFFINKDKFDFGNNIVQIAWGVFPNN